MPKKATYEKNVHRIFDLIGRCRAGTYDDSDRIVAALVLHELAAAIGRRLVRVPMLTCSNFDRLHCAFVAGDCATASSLEDGMAKELCRLLPPNAGCRESRSEGTVAPMNSPEASDDESDLTDCFEDGCTL